MTTGLDSPLALKESTMQRRWGAVALAAALALGAAQPALAADGDKPVRVLFVLGSPPFHDIRTLPPILEKVLDQVGGFQVTRLEPPKDKPPDDAAHLAKLADVKRSEYDVLLFYTSKYQLDELQERALEKFVEDGGGLVGLHGASFQLFQLQGVDAAPGRSIQRPYPRHTPFEHRHY